MSNESYRPSKTTKVHITTTLIIPTTAEDIREYAPVSSRGHTINRIAHIGKIATVILGKKEDPIIVVTPDDTMFTCIFGVGGQLSALPKKYRGTEVTIIYKQ